MQSAEYDDGTIGNTRSHTILMEGRKKQNYNQLPVNKKEEKAKKTNYKDNHNK